MCGDTYCTCTPKICAAPVLALRTRVVPEDTCSSCSSCNKSSICGACSSCGTCCSCSKCSSCSTCSCLCFDVNCILITLPKHVNNHVFSGGSRGGT